MYKTKCEIIKCKSVDDLLNIINYYDNEKIIKCLREIISFERCSITDTDNKYYNNDMFTFWIISENGYKNIFVCNNHFETLTGIFSIDGFYNYIDFITYDNINTFHKCIHDILINFDCYEFEHKYVNVSRETY